MHFPFQSVSIQLILISFCLFYGADVTVSVSLNDFICKRKPESCFASTADDRHVFSGKRFLSSRHRHIPSDFSSWDDYGRTVPDGTGYGPGVGYGPGPQFHPGLGEVAVRTGVNVHYPYGNFGYRRDFELGFGGSGRIGGQTIGFGEGYGNNGEVSGLPGWPHTLG